MKNHHHDHIGIRSSSMSNVATSSFDSKPVIVRVKRKANHSPLEAIWIEINDRSLKRTLFDFEKLAISDSSTKEVEINERPLKRQRMLLDFEKLAISDSSIKGESRIKKVLVHHVKTIINSDDLSVDFLQSFMLSKASKPKLKKRGESHSIKADKRQNKLLAKDRNDWEVLSKTARFEQIQRSKTKIEVVHEICRLYDFVRIDEKEVEKEVEKEEKEVEKEDKKEDKKKGPDIEELMGNYLPLLRKFIPDVALEVETNIKVSKNDYVYDVYAVKNDIINITRDDEPFAFPVVLQVVEDDEDEDDEDEDDSYDSDNESYDSIVEDDDGKNYFPDEEDDDDDEDGNEPSDSEGITRENIISPHVK